MNHRPRAPRPASTSASLPTFAALLAAGIAFAPAVGAQEHHPSRGGLRPTQPHPPTPPATPPAPPTVHPTPHQPPTTPATPRPPDHPVNVRGGEGKVSVVPVAKPL